MIYSSRLKKILHYCLTKGEEYVSLDELADLLKISKRTIFRELKDVDMDLASYECKLVNTSGKGLRIEGSDAHKKELLQELRTQGIEYINKEERTQLLMFELLHNNEVTKLIHYANVFQVSEATISNDLDVIEDWLKKQKLTLVRKPGIGVVVTGEETHMRRAMTQLLHQTLQRQSYNEVNYLDSQSLLEKIFIKEDQGSIMRLLNQDILERILQVFHHHQHELSLDRYAQSSYIGLIIHLVIAIERILKEEEIADNEQVLAMIQDDVSFLQAKKMATVLEIEFDIDIPNTEVAFIALHIKGAKINTIEYRDIENEEYAHLSSMIQEMLSYYSEAQRLLLVQDEELQQGLLTHLGPTLIRLRNHLPIYNPLCEQIKEMYTDLFTQTKQACEVIEKAINNVVSEDEVAFITMHIGASLERMRQHTPHRDVTIGVVCASGIGVSALLSSRIQKVFPTGVHLRTLSMEEILQHEYEDCELLVSTFPLTNTSVEVYCVSPLLHNENIQYLRKAIETLSIKEKAVVQYVKNDFLQEVNALRHISDDILEIIQNISYTTSLDLLSYEEILDCIARDHGSDAQQVQTIKEDLYKREAMGSIIMQDYNFALFHAKSSGVSHCVFHLYYPSSDAFEHERFKDVKFIITMLNNEGSSLQKQKMLGEITRSLIDDETFYRSIIQRDKQEIHQHICNILHTYLITYLEEHL